MLEIESIGAGGSNAVNGEKKSIVDVNVVGVIYPPTEVRNIVDKTASFVARNGPDFEVRIRQNEINNPKFNFLNPEDPYHAYYQFKVKDLRDGKGKPTQPQIAGANTTNGTICSGGLKQPVNQTVQQKQQEILKQLEKPFVPKDPPAEFEFIAEPPSISAVDLDIVKLTALLVARNGRQFLNQLMNREQKNYQFDFLRPQHSLFQYFTKLLEQYTKVLIPPKNIRDRLSHETKDAILENVKYRAEWFKYQDAQRRKEEEIQEKERMAYAQIDWHDFVVVEVVDYLPYESGNFPPPTTPEEVGARLLIQERIEDGQDIEMQIDSDEERGDSQQANLLMSNLDINVVGPTVDMERNSSDENDSDDDETLVAPPRLDLVKVPITAPVQPPIPDKVLVKKYDPKQIHRTIKPNPSEEYLISPLTGEKVPASKFQEHLHHRLLDSRWVEQREKHVQEKMAEENVYAAGTSIEASLKQLAERRTDIFGVGDEETTIGKKIGEEDVRKDDKVTWDGHSSSIEATTRAASSNISIEEQIHQIHKVKGLLTDDDRDKIGPKSTKPATSVINSTIGNKMPVTQPVMLQQSQPLVIMPPSTAPPIIVPTMPPFMGNQMLPPPPNLKHGLDTVGSSDEPANKKIRSEDSLVPEDVFLDRNASTVTFKVVVPNITEKPEWKLNGQTLSLTMALSDTVTAVKTKIFEDTAMPTAKQKLFYDGMFFKDSNSLAYYNILPGTILHLQLKERGGRKK